MVEGADLEEQYLEARAEQHALQKQRHALEQSSVADKTKKVDPVSVVMLVLAVACMVAALWVSFLWIGAVVCLGVASIFAALHAKRCKKAEAQVKENEQAMAQLDEALKHVDLRVQAAERAVRFEKLWRSTYPGEPCPGATEAALCIERLVAQSERLAVLIEKKKNLNL